MASATEHQERANHNEALLPALEKLDTHPDWYITAAFYAAVHWLRAFLALHRVGRSEEITYQEFPRHLRDIARITGLKVEHLIQQFEDFRDLSHQSRYNIRSKHWYDQRLHEADNALTRIREFVLKNQDTE